MSQTATPRRFNPALTFGVKGQSGKDKEMEMLQKLALSDPGETKAAWDKRYAFFSNPNMKNAHGQWLKAVRGEVTGHKYDQEPPNQELIRERHLAPLQFKPGAIERNSVRLFTEDPRKYSTFNGGGHFSNRFIHDSNEDPWHWGKDVAGRRPKWDTPEPYESLQDSVAGSSMMAASSMRQSLGRPAKGENLGSTGAVSFDRSQSQIERFRGKCHSRRAPMPREVDQCLSAR